jgi:hypothetical protein
MKKLFRPIALLALLLVGFGQAKAYDVIIGTFDNGSVSASPSTDLAQGATVTLTVTPADGYVIDEIHAYRRTDTGSAQVPHRTAPNLGEEVSLTWQSMNTYTFAMPEDNVEVIASFKENILAYAVYNANTTTLTFAYGAPPTGVTYYNALIKGWDQNQENLETNVTKVVFDESFADARPTSCYGWFQNFTALKTIEGMEYLNTSEASDMSYMFYGCTSLSSLTIGNGFTVTENIATDHIFITTADNFSAYPLSEGTLTIKGNPTIEKDIFGNVFFYGTLLSENALTVGKNDNGEISWKGGGFVKYNNYYLVKPDYGFATKDGNNNEVYMALPGATITISMASGFEEMNMTPKAIHYNSGSEVIEKVTLTKNGDVWTFTMPEFPVQITEVRFTAAISWSQDQKTLTIFGADTDDVPMQGQMVTNPMRYMMYTNGQMGQAQNPEIGQLFEALHNNVETVVFDAETLSSIEGSLNGQRLLYGFKNLTTITGFENLNMQNFYNTTEMFAGCESLASLTIGSNFIVKAAQYENKWGEQENFDITDMFAGCTALANGTLNVTGVPTINQDIFSGVFTEGTLLTDPDDLLGNAVTEETDYFLWKGGHFVKYNDQEIVKGETLTFAAGQEWGTYFTDASDLALPEGMTAYYVSGVDLNANGETGTMTLVSTGSKLYQNVPTLIQRASTTQALEAVASQATYDDGDAVRTAKHSYFQGTAAGETFQQQAANNATFFVLRSGAFIKATPTTIAAHRCWLAIPKSSAQSAPSASSLVFNINKEGNTTGVNDVRSKMDDVSGEYYNLAGQRVAQPTKGIYISNGKKVIVK